MNWIVIVILAVVGFVLLVCIIAVVVVWRLRARNAQVELFLPGSETGIKFHHLLVPYFDPKNSVGSEWTRHGKFLSKELRPGSADYERMSSLFANYLDGGIFIERAAIVRAFEIYNPSLANNFACQRSILRTRIEKDPSVFLRTDWKSSSNATQQSIVRQHFDGAVDRVGWNHHDSLTPILSVVHGTNSKLAWKIVETGFASLASLDAGWYGSGMYFTTSAQYATPYFVNSTHPAILICLVSCGNPYPVVEERTSPKSLVGLPIKSGYQSNYVLTSKGGKIATDVSGDVFDEIVIPQESQVIPIFLLELDYSAAAKLASAFQRDVPKSAGHLSSASVTVDEVQFDDSESRIVEGAGSSDLS